MSKKVIFEGLAGLMLLGLLIFGILAFQAYRQPIAEPLSIVMQATSAAGPTTPLATVQPTAEPICGLNGTTTVLVIGRDERHWEEPFGADAIRLVKLDFDQKKITLFAFQRDLRLPTTGLEAAYEIKEYRLGPIYELVREKEGNVTPDADVKATNAVAQVLYDNFEITPDHYVTIEENVLADMITTVDGIEVDVPEAIESDFLTLKAGKQKMAGPTAMLYSRYLKNGYASEDEWARLDRQLIVFTGLRDKLITPAVFPKVPELYQNVRESLVTDLSPEMIINLACVAQQLDRFEITNQTIDRDQLEIFADETMVIKNMDAVKKILTELFGKKG